MTTLRLFLAESTPIDVYAWVLLDAEQHVLRSASTSESSNSALWPIADTVEVILPAKWLSFTRVPLPNGFRKLNYDALPFLIEDQIITPPEQTHVVLIDANTPLFGVFSSMERTLIEEVVSFLNSKQLEPQRLLTATLLPNRPQDTWVLIADEAQSFVRTEDANGFSLELEPEGNLPFSLLLALQEADQKQEAPEEIKVYGGAFLPVDRWQAECREAGVNVAFSRHSGDWKTSYVPKEAVNLLQGPFSPRSSIATGLKHVKPGLYIGLACIVLSFMASFTDWGLKTLEKRRLDAEMRQLFSDTFPGTPTIVDAPLQMHRQWSDLQHASGNAADQDFLPLLAQITEHSGGLPHVSAIEFDQNVLAITLTMESETAFRQLAERLLIPGRITVVEQLKPHATGVIGQLAFKVDGE